MGADEADGEQRRARGRGVRRRTANEPKTAHEGRAASVARSPRSSTAPRVDRPAGTQRGSGEVSTARDDRAGEKRSADAPSQIESGALRVVLMTAPDLEVARMLARELVGRRVLACVNVIPAIESIYRWRGVIEEAREVLLVAKTTAERVPELERLLAELHPYEVPECVALEPASVAETAPADPGR
jgi:periplasmic divalent cation tolerance protein